MSRYVQITAPENPMAARNGRVMKHRVVVSEKLGRPLLNFLVEQVHHRDSNPANNSPDNLQLVSVGEHRRIHRGWILRDGRWFKKCRGCDEVKEVTRANFYFYARKSSSGLVRSQSAAVCIRCGKLKVRRFESARVAKGKCKFCAAPKAEGLSLCLKHAAWMRDNARRLRGSTITKKCKSRSLTTSKEQTN